MHHSHSVTVMMKSLVITSPTLSSLLYPLSAAQLLSFSPLDKTNLLSILRTVNTGGASYDEHYQIYTQALLTDVPYAQRSLNLCNVMPLKSLTER